MIENMLCLIFFQMSILLNIKYYSVLRKVDIPLLSFGNEKKKVFIRQRIFYDFLSLISFLISYFIFRYYWKVPFGKSFILLFTMFALQKTSVTILRKWITNK
jgi:hypothetical protein